MLTKQSAIKKKQKEKWLNKIIKEPADADNRRNGDKRKYDDNDNNDKLSVVIPGKRPKELQSHYLFHKSSHWDTPTTRR